jgi:hypothetical protein
MTSKITLVLLSFATFMFGLSMMIKTSDAPLVAQDPMYREGVGPIFLTKTELKGLPAPDEVEELRRYLRELVTLYKPGTEEHQLYLEAIDYVERYERLGRPESMRELIDAFVRSSKTVTIAQLKKEQENRQPFIDEADRRHRQRVDKLAAWAQGLIDNGQDDHSVQWLKVFAYQAAGYPAGKMRDLLDKEILPAFDKMLADQPHCN